MDKPTSKVRAAWVCALAALALLLAAPADAGILDAIARVGGKTARSAATHGGSALETLGAHVRSLPVKPGRTGLAAEATHEGHWRFLNRAGETVTAASPEELARAIAVLAPEAAGGSGSRLALYLTEDTVFAQRALLKDLPKGAELNVMVGRDAYRLLVHGEGAGSRLFAEVRPRLIVEVSERSLFDEAVWQLARPLNRADIRVIALEPGGPATLTSAPRLDAATKRAVTDAIDPDRLRHSLANIRGQTALLTGRVEGDLLYFKPASGPERSLLVRDLEAAAEAADVNLVILRSSSARQPGARNWLWQRAEVERLDAAVERSTIADFLDALGGETGRMTVTASEAGRYRATLDIRPARGIAGEPAGNPISSAFTEILSEVTAKVVLHGVSGHMRSAERDRELEARLIPGIPAAIQGLYLGGWLAGLIGWPVSRRWWRRLWAPEQRAEYASASAFRMAQAARGVTFAGVFLPLIGPIALLVHLAEAMWRFMIAPFRWLARRRAA